MIQAHRSYTVVIWVWVKASGIPFLIKDEKIKLSFTFNVPAPYWKFASTLPVWFRDVNFPVRFMCLQLRLITYQIR